MRPERRAAEVDHAGREHLGAAARLVVGHLGALARAEGVRDPGQHADAPRRPRGAGVDLDPVPAEAVTVPQTGAPEDPGGGRGDLVRHVGVVVAVPVDVLDADERRLGAAEVAPPPRPVEARAAPLDAIEEVVRREEHEVAAEIAVALDDVVGVGRDVLLVAGEDDQVVRTGEQVAGDALEVVVREDVRLDPPLREPAQEPAVVAAELGRRAALEVRPGEVDARDARVRVPRVADAVAVDVAPVVGLPRVGREDDGDAVLAERRRAHDERRPADPARAGHARDIEAARPVTDPDRGSRAVHRHRPRHCDSCEGIATGEADTLDPHGLGTSVPDHERRRRAGCVAALREGGFGGGGAR